MLDILSYQERMGTFWVSHWELLQQTKELHLGDVLMAFEIEQLSSFRRSCCLSVSIGTSQGSRTTSYPLPKILYKMSAFLSVNQNNELTKYNSNPCLINDLIYVIKATA